MHRQTLAAASAALLLVLTTGCSSGGALLPQTTVTATETTTAGPAMLHADSLTGLKDELVDAGLICDGWSVLSENFSATCDDLTILTINYDPSDSNVTRLYYSSFDLSYTAIASGKRSDVALLVGDNCFVRLATADAAYLADVVGGAVLSI